MYEATLQFDHLIEIFVETEWPTVKQAIHRIKQCGFKHCPGLCIVLDKTLYSDSASLRPGV